MTGVDHLTGRNKSLPAPSFQVGKTQLTPIGTSRKGVTLDKLDSRMGFKEQLRLGERSFGTSKGKLPELGTRTIKSIQKTYFTPTSSRAPPQPPPLDHCPGSKVRTDPNIECHDKTRQGADTFDVYMIHGHRDRYSSTDGLVLDYQYAYSSEGGAILMIRITTRGRIVTKGHGEDRPTDTHTFIEEYPRVAVVRYWWSASPPGHRPSPGRRSRSSRRRRPGPPLPPHPPKSPRSPSPRCVLIPKKMNFF